MMGVLHKLRVAVWGEAPATKEESRLLFKIDWFILSYVCLMYWVNYLDRANLNNAYVSGAKEDLGFRGTQLNQINTIFYGGYLLGQIPNNLILQRVPPRIWLPTTCMVWGFLTLGTGFTHHPWQIMVIRFFQGFFESSCFVGVQWILGSWYKPEEIGKRTAIFTSSGLAGTLFSGIMQGSIYTNLNGKAGLAGWRWLFVIDFLITLPVAIYGFLLFPDTPTSTKAWYFSPHEKVMVVERLPEVEKKRGVLGWSLIKRVVLSWHWWAFVLMWIAGSNTEMYSSNAIMQLYLKSTHDYTTQQVNYIPSSVSGLGIVATLLLGWYSDYNTRRRWHVGIFLSFTAITSGSLMLSPPSRAAKFAALILNGCQFAGQTVFFAWANDLTRKDDAKRSVVLASMNMFSVAVYLFWSLLFYNATQAPDWYEGSCAMIAMGCFTLIMTIVCYLLQRRQEKHEAIDAADWALEDIKAAEVKAAEVKS
ncbi:uncharacterized protein MYCFIDRAFT_43123 [Pseudocercospora fijiensis CIRAD86]|uniref:Major facilitator superfamily (MFS) profile domain-containing protein n=1 Tax=Pseudocercospora fijiensis (strain CIRAD86) TaxID=383855 RepID=M3ACF9_PSEFD|nr:uncharacterized protein MYCFIDRAFT_43123 [Pseudocercospora fijiensis CIRAD86]EME82236.1 hypothetical protein MYCFIDRAFT_43123 [Pseudocercospora fijiensis CIRAD86]